MRALPVSNAVQVEVADQGIGVPADEVDKIFERFYQVDGSSKRRFAGTGLGLAIVKQIIEAHKGKVWVESKVNEGSRFHISLPLLERESVPADPLSLEVA